MTTGIRHPAARAALTLVALFGACRGATHILSLGPTDSGTASVYPWLLWPLALAWAAAPASAQTGAPPLVNPLNDAADLSAALRPPVQGGHRRRRPGLEIVPTTPRPSRRQGPDQS